MSSVATSHYPKTVLLVEDDEDCRDEIAGALEHVGYGVLRAGDGREGLQLLRGAMPRPQLILLDWMMPVMDGMTFLTHQASDPRYSAIPVVVVSAVASMARIPTLCVAAVLGKPVRARTLIEIVDRMCGTPPRGDGEGGGGLVIGGGSPSTSSSSMPAPAQENRAVHRRTSSPSGLVTSSARRAAIARNAAWARVATARRRFGPPTE